MTERPNFDRQYIENELQKLAATLVEKNTVFVAGGAAMSFYGLKEATKDIDVVVQTKANVDSLVLALRALGYSDPRQGVTINYVRMRATAILENIDGFRWDIFEQVVAKKLVLSKGMIKRSQLLFDRGNLQVRLLSKEDIFLLKSVTERDRDVEDMAVVAESGVDWNVIAAECDFQSLHSRVVWEDALCSRLMDLREKRGIVSPIEKRICRIADQKFLERWIVRKAREGTNTIKGLAKEAGEPEHLIRRAVEKLVRMNRLGVDRSTKPYRFISHEEPED